MGDWLPRHVNASPTPTSTINSSPEGLYRNSYNLTWSIKSSSPLEKVRILFRKMDQFTNKNTNGTWSNILVGLPHYWNSDPYHTQQQKNPSDHRLTRGYSVHSHLFRNLEADTRYEVIVQSQNQFGWSEPTKPFIFSTRYQDYSPLNMASHPSFRGGLISSSNQITLSSTTTAISLFILLLMHHRIWANFFRWYVFTMGSKSFWRRVLIFMNLWVYGISFELSIFYRLNELFISISSKAHVQIIVFQIMTCSFWPGFVDIVTVFLQTGKYLI